MGTAEFGQRIALAGAKCSLPHPQYQRRGRFNLISMTFLCASLTS